MNIAIVTPYGEAYSKDRLFDVNACKIGENLLVPGIELKKRMEQLGHQFHTVDMFSFDEIDVLIFQDINNESINSLNSLIDFAKYCLKRKWRKDYLHKMIKRKQRIKSILIAQEPPVIFPNSYKTKYHNMFDCVLTWNDDLVDGNKIIKYQYPQVKPDTTYHKPFDQKKDICLIASNKKSHYPNELYSERYKFIQFMDDNNYEFDLYGMGWESENFRSYRGKIEKKYDILSQYKFSLCYENMCNINGYITEKIFDCFFCGVVPIYWGADNIGKYISESCFIDRRKFSSLEMLIEYILGMKITTYDEYINNARKYINGPEFEKQFSVNSYVEKIIKIIL